MMRVLLAAWLAGCAIDATALPAAHPANPTAPIGRIAPPVDAFGSAMPPTQAPMPMPMPMP